MIPLLLGTVANNISFVIQSKVERVMENPDWRSKESPDVTEGHSTLRSCAPDRITPQFSAMLTSFKGITSLVVGLRGPKEQ